MRARKIPFGALYNHDVDNGEQGTPKPEMPDTASCRADWTATLIEEYWSYTRVAGGHWRISYDPVVMPPKVALYSGVDQSSYLRVAPLDSNSEMELLELQLQITTSSLTSWRRRYLSGCAHS